MKFSKIVLAVATFSMAGGAMAHGYVSQPASRAFMCNANMGAQNKDCGSGPLYEMQSVEGSDGYPELNKGPEDGHIASAGVASMSRLDEQTETRWAKHPITAGLHDFSWTYTAPHKTKAWDYYITKADWNPNQPLTRASFEATPFCHIEGNNRQPGAGADQPHECNVPSREGYHVILAAWDVSDTAATFYNVIDVDFGGHNSPDEDEGPQAVVSPQWHNDSVYVADDKVQWDGKEYQARWWTKGNQPGKHEVWALVK
ncbi:lytic polysaccharide monooxygenase [Kosakonia sp. H02]|nr:lytic polysaccharide monooxygenase [Kosakonia sp. H02]